ncbi:MAG: S8 family peptidase [Flavobacteriaceae bacterium]|nr:S8 family peptidase [Flavobacteriaceae bacterium]
MAKKFILGLGLVLTLASCNTSKSIHKIAVPTDNSTTINIPAKQAEMSEAEIQKWPQADLATDSIPGMSIDKAYDFVSDKEGTIVIVAVIDSGIDINHEDLKDNIWTNSGEIAGNGIDDDKNGYIDDIYGWNFFGSAEGDASPEQLEITRIYKKLNTKYGDLSEDQISKKDKPEYDYYNKVAKDFNEKYEVAVNNLANYEQAKKVLTENDLKAQTKLNKQNYTIEEYKTLPEEDQNPYLMSILSDEGDVQEILGWMGDAIEYFSGQVNLNYNVDFDGRSVTGDDVNDIKDVVYGNAYVVGSLEEEMHGTHVSGIALATRNNGVGMNGVAKNAKLMAVRAVPDGDEYDKDVALAIRYAVDNGAKVINMSFGKSYSPNAEWVYDAIKYAEKKDVLLVHAAGNDGKNIDKNDNFPTDAPDKIKEIADNVITVGAITRAYNENIVSVFSNYGKKNVDIFAPGSEIYSTVPNNEYKSIQGTSMASPEVAGVAALVRSYYPELSASQVKHILINSATKIPFEVILPGSEGTMVSFDQLSVSGGVLNAYNALVLADKMVNGQ